MGHVHHPRTGHEHGARGMAITVGMAITHNHRVWPAPLMQGMASTHVQGMSLAHVAWPSQMAWPSNTITERGHHLHAGHGDHPRGGCCASAALAVQHQSCCCVPEGHDSAQFQPGCA
eukprot:1656-Pelagomonas_calceolata.AAC.4